MILIFSGYNQRAVIAFLRTLEGNSITNYKIIAASNQDTILKTKYKNQVFSIRKNIQLDLDEICNLINQIYISEVSEKILLIPTSEALNRFFLKYRSIFEKYHVVIPLVNEDLYNRISDKNSFWELCRLHHFLVPKQTLKITETVLPIVAKPKTYVSKGGKIFSPVIIQSEEELRNFCREYPVNDFTFQEFIDGKSYYLLYYFSKKGKIYCLSQKNLAQQPNGKSMIAATISRLHEENEIAKRYECFFKSLGFYGFLMIELRNTEENYYMIEANPRFWGPSQLFCNSGFNFFEFFLYDYGIIHELPNRPVDYEAKYLWSGGIQGELLVNDNCVWLEDGKEYVQEHLQEFLISDIYNYPDTIEIYKTESKEMNMQK